MIGPASHSPVPFVGIAKTGDVGIDGAISVQSAYPEIRS